MNDFKILVGTLNNGVIPPSSLNLECSTNR
jgi:hypothetical protein